MNDPLHTESLAAEIDSNRRLEYRLPRYALVALLIVAAVLTVRLLWL